MLVVFLLFQGQWSSVECVRLDPRGAKYVRELVNEFLADPTSSRFDQIILPPQIGEELSDFLHPKVYIWCPCNYPLENRGEMSPPRLSTHARDLYGCS